MDEAADREDAESYDNDGDDDDDADDDETNANPNYENTKPDNGDTYIFSDDGEYSNKNITEVDF